MKQFIVIVAVVCLLANVLISSSAETLPLQDAKQENGSSSRNSHKPPKLVDFANYKRIFNKSYSSLTEAIVRQQNFLTKVFRAVVSLVKYQQGKMSYFLSVNKMSDYTKKELDEMRNWQIREGFANKNSFTSSKLVVANETGEDFLLGPNQNLDQLIEQFVKEFPDSREEFSALKSKLTIDETNREKRETSRRLSLTLDDLINTGKGRGTSPEALRKARRRSSKNVNPRFVEPELFSRGIPDQIEEVNWQDLASRLELEKLSRINRIFKKYGRKISRPNKQNEEEEEEEEDWDQEKAFRRNDSLENEVYFDHRKSNCFWAPRDQLKCGSCYAFAFTSILEWTHCIKTGELLAFSEQYMIDCGSYVGLNKCTGGSYLKAARFGHNFGVLLRTSYPYTQLVGECPYDEDTDLETTGYIRMDLSKSISVPLDRWEEFIHIAPMFTSISTAGDFHEYGGGVYSGANCVHYGVHAVVVVGHGREDGEEYWLIRNSHSVGWGEGGYMKLAKKSRCIEPEFGFIYGADRKKGLLAKVVENPKHDANKIKDLYKKMMLDTLADEED